MIVSWKWLADYVTLDATHEEFARRMMLAGFNHEETVAVDNDWAIDLEITSNRPDCLGQIGLAREAAVLFEKPLNLPVATPATGKLSINSQTQIAVQDTTACPRYIARVIRGIKVGPSPNWLVERLTTLGIASINNLVDITNYILMECGQPLHAFDLQRLSGQQIIVRRAVAGEKIEAINHKTYELQPSMLVIADRDRPVAIAGVMGGASTEVTTTTTDILIESAQFDPQTIRVTARALALHSDSSYRFERGLDPQGVDWASRRCCELILELCGGELCEGVIDCGATPVANAPVRLRYAQLERLIGISYPDEAVQGILTALGMAVVKQDATSITVQPPSWRRDLTREIDLIEEVARVYGYDAIPEDRAVPLVPSARTHIDRVQGKIRQALLGAGLDEVLTLSAVDQELTGTNLWLDNGQEQTPLATRIPVLRRANQLRRTLIPSLLEVRRTNEALSNPRIEIYEIAKVYWPQTGSLPREELMLGICSGGDFFAVKGIIESLLEQLAPGNTLSLKKVSDPLFQPAQGMQLWINDEHLGYLGVIRSKGALGFQFRSQAIVAELRVEVLARLAQLIPQMRELSPFPPVTRDINLVVNEAVRWADVEQTVKQHAGPLLEQLQWRDTYRDEKRLGAGRKSLLFSILLRGQSETLTSALADQVRDQVVQACTSQYGAELRA
jgi:phenylalanyl-tRNA synthetase beta chain